VRNLDFTSWQALLSTLLGLSVITLIGVGIRLLAMQTIQQRRERENRQINERLRTLIAAYKTLGGSFTGNLAVDPAHLADLKRNPAGAAADATEGPADKLRPGSDRSRRIRDAVEAALSDIILLGTEDHVRLAAAAAADLAAGRAVETAALVVSLRDFIRQVWIYSRCLRISSFRNRDPRVSPPRRPAKRAKRIARSRAGAAGWGWAGEREVQA
jgi:hypothetical protein